MYKIDKHIPLPRRAHGAKQQDASPAEMKSFIRKLEPGNRFLVTGKNLDCKRTQWKWWNIGNKAGVALTCKIVTTRGGGKGVRVWRKEGKPMKRGRYNKAKSFTPAHEHANHANVHYTHENTQVHA